jgi:hypothetical protein
MEYGPSRLMRFDIAESAKSIVPEGQAKTAQRLNAGLARINEASPEGTAERRMVYRNRRSCADQPSLWDSLLLRIHPSVETLSYSHDVPPGQTPGEIRKGASLRKRYLFLLSLSVIWLTAFVSALCPLLVHADNAATSSSSNLSQSNAKSSNSFSELRLFRIAIATTGEFARFHGGTTDGARKAVNRTLARVNEIFERDLGIRLALVANNDRLLFLNPADDPFSSNDPTETTIREMQKTVDQLIGSPNYDLGIVFTAGRLGTTFVGSVCDDWRKGSACAGWPVPAGEFFDVGLVAHEIAHQFGANHTFNSDSGDCVRYRNEATAFEPGSGTTIMGYAGFNCGPDRLQANTDPYFHGKTIEEIQTFLKTKTCHAPIALQNRPPLVEPGTSFTIPRGTPFSLRGSASDPDGDAITYCWEECDLGPIQSLGVPDLGAGPLFRSFPPKTSSSRIFPRLEAILNPSQSSSEILPATTRKMAFRLTVRDGRGGVAWQDSQLQVTSSAGPFQVTYPSMHALAGEHAIVTWNVANTDGPPVGATSVQIKLSQDDGLTFPTVLAASTPNDGNEALLLPRADTSSARIMVSAIGNVFFAVSPRFALASSGIDDFRIIDIRSANGQIELTWQSEAGLRYLIEAKNGSGWSSTGISRTATASKITVSLPILDSSQWFRIRKLE